MQSTKRPVDTHETHVRRNIVWTRRVMILCPTVVSLAFAGDETAARARRADSTDGLGPLAVFSIADRVPAQLMRHRPGLGVLSSVPDPFVDVMSLAVAGLGLLGLGRHLSRQKRESAVHLERVPAAFEDGRS
jgi:hypothetical protein